MKRLAFYVDSLAPAQLPYAALKMVPSLQGRGKDVLVFADQIVPPCIQPPCAVLQGTDAYGFTGVLVATSFVTAAKSLKTPAARRIFWLPDLEWMRRTDSFAAWAKVYRDPCLELVARSESHRLAVERAWNREVTVESPEFWAGLLD